MKAYLLLAVVVIVSGCAANITQQIDQGTREGELNVANQQEAREKFESYISKAKNTNYNVQYNLESFGPLIYDNEPEIYSFQGVRKVSRNGTFPSGTNITYNVYYHEDHEIGCHLGYQSNNICNTLPTGAAPSVDYFKDRYELFEISYEGNREIIGRECQQFKLKGNNYEINMCLDTQKGYAASIDRNVYNNTESRTNFEMNATGYSAELSPEDVETSVKAVSMLECSDKTLNITSTDYSGEIKFNLNGYENRTTNLTPWTKKTFNISESMKPGWNTANVYAEGNIDSSECRTTN